MLQLMRSDSPGLYSAEKFNRILILGTRKTEEWRETPFTLNVPGPC